MSRAGGRPPLPAWLRWPGLALAAALALAWRLSDGDVAALLAPEARGAMAEFARGFWPPAHEPEFLRSLLRPLGETVAIAFLGLSLALLLAAPLAWLATAPDLVATSGERPGVVRRAGWAGARTALNLMRSIPEILWALLFVRAVGLGPAAGILALGIGYAGILGKVFAEIFESTPREAARALRAAGAGGLAAFAFGLLPRSLPLLASYALYRFDCALRASAVLGLVGAGGIGLRLELSIKTFAYHEVAAQGIALFALVAGVDLLSQRVRRRIHRSRGLFPVGMAALRARVLALGAWAGLAALAAAFLDLPVADLLSVRASRDMGRFAAALWPPDLDPAFLRQIAPAALGTLAVSVLGTAIAAALGILLAWPAAWRVEALRPGGGGPSPARRVAMGAASWTARAVLALGRTLPEMLWALLLVFAVGLGPFAGALALGIHTAGVLGRLYAEALEEVPSGPVEALRNAGADFPAVSAFAVLPQAAAQLAAYTLYRWEVAIRASAVLGIVGAGGIGALLHVSLGLFHHHRTLTLVAAIVLMVTAVDLFSGWLRRRILEGPAPAGAPPEPRAWPGGPAVADAW
ncbi:MAG TPA: ABC transporter permease subunit [Anaeromyxobacteraceae bacterium]|nr:ABC transporter permease subunit [Anaeromyxobacteraceae bacterium]